MGRPKKLRWNEGDFGVENPGLFSISDKMLKRLRPDLYGFQAWLAQRRHDRLGTYSDRDLIREQLWLGSIQAAIVVSLDPGRVAAYSDMLDCVAMLGVAPQFLKRFRLAVGDRLLTVNYYDDGAKHEDLEFGPGRCSSWTGLLPMIADFISPDRERLAERKANLADRFWQRAKTLGEDYFRRKPDTFRPGAPRA